MRLKNSKLEMIAIIILLITSVLYIGSWGKTANSQESLPSNPAPNLPNRRILIIAPHPDDESLGAGGLISDAVLRGDRVKIVFMTNGDGFHFGVKKFTGHARVTRDDYLNYGIHRQQEAASADSRLGIKENDIIFLGFPDQGLAHIWRDYWDPNKPFTSKQTQSSYVPYHLAMDQGEAYTAPALINSLENIFREYRPTDIYVTGTYDCHPDHWATGAFTFLVVSILEGEDSSFNPRLYTFDIHRADWQIPLVVDKDKTLLPPSYFLDYGDKWYKYALTTKTLENKKQALACYRSQTMVMPSFIKNFERRHELFCLHETRTVVALDSVPRLTTDKWPASSLLAFNPIGHRKQKSGSALKAAYILQQGQNLYLRLVTQGNWNPGASYLVNVYTVPGKLNESVGRVSFRVIPQTRQYKWLDRSTGYNALKVGVEYGTDTIQISLSDILIPGEKSLMINVDSDSNGKIIDRIPWERLAIQSLQ